MVVSSQHLVYGSDTIFWVVSDLTDNSLIEINLLDVQDIYANVKMSLSKLPIMMFAEYY